VVSHKEHLDRRLRYMEALQRPDLKSLDWVIVNSHGSPWVPVQAHSLCCWSKKTLLRNRIFQRAIARKTVRRLVDFDNIAL